ncbi:TPA: DUF3265 domain-containing protein [Vibrio vulnificus]|nr:DUF3265 domain-containing protein [Vibrio vulnificus]
MHAAWHFWFAVSFGGESGLREVGLCGIHPLTQRYVLGEEYGFSRRRRPSRFICFGVELLRSNFGN